MTKHEILEDILFQMERAQRAYSMYREQPVYLHACNIYKGNVAIVELVARHGARFGNPLRSDFLDLLEHLDVWTEQFHHLEEKLKPGPDTKFVFERFKGTKPFPAHIKSLIENELKVQRA